MTASPALLKRAAQLVRASPATNGSQPPRTKAPSRPRPIARAAVDPFAVVEPWPDPVSGAALLDDLAQCVRRHLVLPAHGYEAVALWTLHTYLVDAADYTPYLLVTSPVRECGKSTLLDLLLHLAHRAQQTGGYSAAALYRRIDRQHPALLLDEIDTRLRGDSGEALRGVLNTGFQRSGRVTICSGENHDDRDFATFCPKVLAGIGHVWDTVASRSIPIRLKRASKEELRTLTKIRGHRIADECADHRRRAARFAADNLDQLQRADPVTPEQLSARQSDVWRPLLAIADAAGGAWPNTARNAALALHGAATEEGDTGLLVLQDLATMFGETDSAVLPTVEILGRLVKMEDRPWPEYRNGKELSARGLASLLGRFDVKPRTHRTGAAETVKGYSRADLQPVFTTYLPTPSGLSVTAVTSTVQAPVTDVTDRLSGVGLVADRPLDVGA